MDSNILRKDQLALTNLCRTMKPEKRLVAFFNHSRLIQQFYQAGKRSRRRSPTSLQK